MKKIFLYSLLVLVGFIVLSVLFFSIRQGLANAQIKREGQAVPTSVPNLGTTTQLAIIPLYDEDRMDRSFDFGHGVSYLIRTDSSTVLMDLGNNPAESPQLPSLKNMQALGIAWEEIDALVISHPHPDHVGGVKAWQNKTISFGDFAGDLTQTPIYTPISMAYPGAKIIYSPEPSLVSKDIATTGVISFPEVYPLSLSNPKGHEQALVIHVAGQGLVMITGCGHPTLEKLVSRAEMLFGGQVVAVVGGLHYEGVSTEDVQPHIQFLQARQPKLVAPSPHDSSPEALKAFQSAFPEAYQLVRVGETIQFP
ncbi:MAG TPA: MBL fold metallo-hydrolase [Anaerolineales bacterium]|nr:MBL fold metallo-hydrolase [Anaerolineales bacterium]